MAYTWNLDAFGGGVRDVDDTTLSFLKKFDPGAGFSAPWENSEGHTRGGEFGADLSKYPKSRALPDFKDGATFQQLTGFYTHAYDPYGKVRKDLINPNQIINDPVYGAITSRNNVKDQKPGLIDILGPLAVGGIAGFANPGAFAALSGGAKAAMAAPTLARTWDQKGKLSPLDIMGLAAPFAASALPGPLGSLAKTGLSAYNTYNAFNKGNTVTGLSGLYNTGRSLLPVTGGS